MDELTNKDMKSETQKGKKSIEPKNSNKRVERRPLMASKENRVELRMHQSEHVEEETRVGVRLSM